MNWPAFAARPLEPRDHAAAIGVAAAAGAHGVYVRNFLAAAAGGREDGEILALHGQHELLGLALFGGRGNLIVLEREPLEPAAVAATVRAAAWTWRIVLGPADVVAALRATEESPPLVDRRQVYYGVAPADVPGTLIRADVRLAERRDLPALVDASLQLNLEDLNVSPRRVYRPWLKESLRRRLRARRVWVIGAPGQPLAKLDAGSRGPAGMVVEGVYTVPECRGQGLASGLVASVARAAVDSEPMICLHVAAANIPARRAYERVGMTVRGECRLLLRA